MTNPKITSIASTNATEGGANGIFTITLDSPAPVGGLVVNYDTTGSSALLTSDYSLLAGANISNLTANSFVINAGATTANLTVQAKTDKLIDTENVNLNLTINTISNTASFANKINYVAGNQPFLVTSGDFNNDGKLDLAVGNANSHDISILLRNSDNTDFDTSINYATDTYSTSLATGDFNNDNKLDLVVSNLYRNSISVLLRNASNTGYDSKIEYQTGTQPFSVITGDFNNDGKFDLAVTYYESQYISVLLRNANNTGFEPKIDYQTGSTAYGSFAYSMVAGDFNGDGKFDLAVIDGVNTVSVLLRNSSNTGFEPKVNYTVGKGPTSVISGDFNADGKLDLAVANNNTGKCAVSVFLRNTHNTDFEPKIDYIIHHEPTSLAVGDFNNDGRLDLAVGNISYNIELLLGNASNTGFEPEIDVVVGNTPQSVIAGDFNNDGKLDLAMGNTHINRVSVLMNTTPNTQTVSKSLTIIDTSNHAPTGSVTINDTTPQENQILIASNTLADPDGMGAITYTWKTGTTVLATASSYKVTKADVGKTITVTASYTDLQG
ncbi:MAG: VCBS repeat-containing protein, partial [Methylococcaceae bacterium]